jgi:predicted RNase H-like HicB family nuclease
VDIASQGSTVEEARSNLIEALELFFEAADPSGIESRVRSFIDGDRVEFMSVAKYHE